MAKNEAQSATKHQLNLNQIEQSFKKMKVDANDAKNDEKKYEKNFEAQSRRKSSVKTKCNNCKLKKDSRFQFHNNCSISCQDSNYIGKVENNPFKKVEDKSKTLINDKDFNHEQSKSQNSIDDYSVEELAAYFDDNLFLPKKMSFMAEMMYT